MDDRPEPEPRYLIVGRRMVRRGPWRIRAFVTGKAALEGWKFLLFSRGWNLSWSRIPDQDPRASRPDRP